MQICKEAKIINLKVSRDRSTKSKEKDFGMREQNSDMR